MAQKSKIEPRSRFSCLADDENNSSDDDGNNDDEREGREEEGRGSDMLTQLSLTVYSSLSTCLS